MALLTLTASDCAGPNHSDWSLHDVDADGRRNRLLADFDVRLDPADWQHAAWLDLHGYVPTRYPTGGATMNAESRPRSARGSVPTSSGRLGRSWSRWPTTSR